MYSSATLIENFRGLVGLFQAYDPAYQRLPEFLRRSTSGKYVQTTHPLCTLENLWNSGPEFSKFDYPAWVDQDYVEGTIVTNGGKLWRASETIPLGYAEPVEDSDFTEEYDEELFGSSDAKWKEYDPFVEWLIGNMNAAIIEMMADVVRFKRLEHSSRALLNSQFLFDGIGFYTDRIIKDGSFRGLEISLSSQEGIQAVISRLGLQLDTVQTINVYLYHTSVAEPLGTFPLNVQKASTFNWQSVEDAILKFYDPEHDTAGTFILGYYDADLVGQAIKKDYNWLTGPCAGCNEYNSQAFNSWSKYIKISAISVSPGDLPGDRTLWDVRKNKYDGGTNWGMNIALSVYCDLTEVFSANAFLFSNALAHKMCLKFLGEIAYSTRISAIPDKTKSLAMADIDQSAKNSFYTEYRLLLEDATVDFTGMNSACMPCVNSARIKMGSV